MISNDPDDISLLPVNPGADEILEAYQLCRKKLVRANRSRGALKVHDDYLRNLIRDLREQLQSLSADMLNETAPKGAAYQTYNDIAELVRLLESALDDAATISEGKGDQSFSAWAGRIAQLVKLFYRLGGVRVKVLQLLGRQAASPIQLPSALPPEPPDITNPKSAAPQVEGDRQIRQQKPERTDEIAYGPLLLKSYDYIYGVLLLAPRNQTAVDGLRSDPNSPWLPGQLLLVPEDPEEPDIAPIEAGFLAIEPGSQLLPELTAWIDRGILPFAIDPGLKLPRLAYNPSVGVVSHVLVREEMAAAFQDQIGGRPFELDGDHWLGFQIAPDDVKDLWSVIKAKPGRSEPVSPRLSTRGGVPMVDGQGFLATGLGLPFLALPRSVSPVKVQLVLADGRCMAYEPIANDEPSLNRLLWQPSVQDRRRPELAEGSARFTARLQDGGELERSIQLTALAPRIRFQRTQPLTYREDWGLTLGPLELPEPAPPAIQPSEESIQWVRQKLIQADVTVDHTFEQQMLESLSALFQRRSSIYRREFIQLYAQLRNKPDEWPRFPEAVLRGWCEGGWLEEGVERKSGRWRIQPVDPRLVRLHDGRLQLVGLLTSRRLIAVLANAHQLDLDVQSVLPNCPDMPRGWRFSGETQTLGSACGLPVVDQDDWVPDPTKHLWIIETPLASDIPHWPRGVRARPPLPDRVCGRRGIYHWRPSQPLPEGYLDSIDLKIEAEISAYGKRRWYSKDPVRDKVFQSCHRNRVALHALIVKTNGLWPFGFTNLEAGQIDRLYDADAYLPLPIGRHAALTGRQMPGPTRLRPEDHTYRYNVDLSLRAYQSRRRFLPLTPFP
jgi:hypothetical protein